MVEKAVTSVERFSDNLVLVRLSKPARAISTVPPVVGPDGLVESIIFAKVSESFSCERLTDFYRDILRSVGIGSGVVFLSAVSPEELIDLELSEVRARIFMTISPRPPTCLESPEVYESLRSGTVNIAVVIEEPLSFSAMVDLVKTVTEAKAAAFSDVLVRCESRAVGTVSDAVAILKPVDIADEMLFSGFSTRVGRAVARAVYGALVSKILGEDVNTDLKRVIGLGINELLDIFEHVYSKAAIPGLNTGEARERAREILAGFLKDPNVWSFLIAARELDLHGLAGTIPGLTSREFRDDSVKIVADEVLGLALALYLAGIKGMFSMYWVERIKKRGELPHDELGVFEDDVVSALVGSIITVLLDSFRGPQR